MEFAKLCGQPVKLGPAKCIHRSISRVAGAGGIRKVECNLKARY
jgi:hypothetical protein